MRMEHECGQKRSAFVAPRAQVIESLFVDFGVLAWWCTIEASLTWVILFRGLRLKGSLAV